MMRAILMFTTYGVVNAFVPISSPTVSSATMLQGAFDGTKFNPSRNPYARGGKEPWQFELDTMYVEEPKPKKVVAKPVVAKKVVPQKPLVVQKSVPKKPVIAKQAVPKKPVTKKDKTMTKTTPKVPTKKGKVSLPKKEVPKNAFLALFQK